MKRWARKKFKAHKVGQPSNITMHVVAVVFVVVGHQCAKAFYRVQKDRTQPQRSLQFDTGEMAEEGEGNGVRYTGKQYAIDPGEHFYD